jgi:tRNA G18 (ribose-2'-O)-methylase SpoU
VAWQYWADTLEAVEQLKAEGYTVFAVEQVHNSVLLPDLTLDATKKYAVVLGNEVKGVKQEVVDASHYALEIPQYGTKHSLNVSVTAGIVMWEFLKRLPLA